MKERIGRQILEDQNCKNGFVSIGLDTDMRRLLPLFPFTEINTKAHPNEREIVVAFNRAVLEVTADIPGAIKINPAFYKFLGRDCFDAIQQTVFLTQRICPDKLIIIDGKYGDVGHTNEGHAFEAFKEWRADAVTLNGYVEESALQKSFLDRKDKLNFLLVKTSSSDLGEIQNLKLSSGNFLHQKIAKLVSRKRGWNKFNNCGGVVGTKDKKEAKAIRKIVGPEFPILVPGVGTQGINVEDVVQSILRPKDLGFVSESRGIIFPNLLEGESFLEGVRRKALNLQISILNSQLRG